MTGLAGHKWTRGAFARSPVQGIREMGVVLVLVDGVRAVKALPAPGPAQFESLLRQTAEAVCDQVVR